MSIESSTYNDDYIPQASQEGLQRIEGGTAHLQDSSQRQEQVARPTQTTEEVQERESTQESQQVVGGIDIFDNDYSSKELNDSIFQLNFPDALSLKQLAIVRSEERRIASIANGFHNVEEKTGSVQDILTNHEKGKGVLRDLRINLKGSNLKVYNQDLRYEGTTLTKTDTCRIDTSADPLFKTIQRGSKTMLMVAITDSEGLKGYTAAHAIEPIPDKKIDEAFSRLDNPNSWGIKATTNTPEIIKEFIQFNIDNGLAEDPQDFDFLERASQAFPLGFEETKAQLKAIEGNKARLAANFIKRIESINTEDQGQTNIESIVDLYEEVKTLLLKIEQEAQTNTVEEIKQTPTSAPRPAPTPAPEPQATQAPTTSVSPQPAAEPKEESDENLEQTDSQITKTLFKPQSVSADGLTATYNPDAVRIMTESLNTIQEAKSAILQIENALLYYRTTKGEKLQTDLTANLNFVKSNDFNTYALKVQIAYLSNIIKPIIEASNELPGGKVSSAIEAYKKINFNSIPSIVREFDYRDVENITKGENLIYTVFNETESPRENT